MRQEEVINQVELRINELASQIKNVAIEGAVKTRTAKGFHDIEQKIIGLCRELAGGITETVLVAIIEDRQWEDEKVNLFKRTNLRRIGRRSVVVVTLSGVEVKVEAEYLAPKKSKKRVLLVVPGQGLSRVYYEHCVLVVSRGLQTPDDLVRILAPLFWGNAAQVVR
jgi:hypothetical protein